MTNGLPPWKWKWFEVQPEGLFLSWPVVLINVLLIAVLVVSVWLLYRRNIRLRYISVLAMSAMAPAGILLVLTPFGLHLSAPQLGWSSAFVVVVAIVCLTLLEWQQWHRAPNEPATAPDKPSGGVAMGTVESLSPKEHIRSAADNWDSLFREVIDAVIAVNGGKHGDVVRVVLQKVVSGERNSQALVQYTFQHMSDVPPDQRGALLGSSLRQFCTQLGERVSEVKSAITELNGKINRAEGLSKKKWKMDDVNPR